MSFPQPSKNFLVSGKKEQEDNREEKDFQKSQKKGLCEKIQFRLDLKEKGRQENRQKSG